MKKNNHEIYNEIMQRVADVTRFTEAQKLANAAIYANMKQAAAVVNQSNLESGVGTYPVMFGYIDPENLVIDYYDSMHTQTQNDYERGFVYGQTISKRYAAQLDKLAASFDMSKFTPIIVWYDEENQIYRVIDGGHRGIMAIFLGLHCIPMMNVDLKSPIEAAKWYITQYACSTRLSSAELLIGKIAAKDKEALIIDKWLAINEWGLKGIRQNVSGLNIGCFKTISDIAKNYGKAGLDYCSDIITHGLNPTDKQYLNVRVFKVCEATYPLAGNNKVKRNKLVNALKAAGSFAEFDSDAKTACSKEVPEGKNGEKYAIAYALKIING